MKICQLTFPVSIAHRGYNVKFPENTLSAFEAAIDLGAQIIEFDVSFTKDRQLVVIHDDTLDRTTNGSGLISDHLLSDLRELDAGSWFDPNYKNEKLPTLDEVLELIGNKSIVNIEIKEEYYEAFPQPDSIEQQILNLVRQKNMLDSTIISSFEIRYLERISKLEDVPALAYISRKPADEAVFEKCKSLGLYSWNPWYAIVTEEQVKAAHSAGLKVFSFTVNDSDDFRKLIDMGVDGVFSDDFRKLEKGLC